MVNQQFATAVHVMTALGYSCSKRKSKKEPNELLSSEFIAKSVNTNPVVIRRLLGQLSKAGLVQTTRGKMGGVCLAKDASLITLKDIYLGIEFTEKITPHNKSPHPDCPVSTNIHDIMSNICSGFNKVTLKYLESIKLSDLVKTVLKSAKPIK